ncbi:MAG: glycosyltransferase N-terminal domain-containing protein, partial [Campylobacterota bacterium]|nr:glycosyltransferase N-terminal domain-containing protein [Campylobacterota bacterium]
MNLFSLFYLFVALVFWVLALPFLLYKSRSNKYKDAIPARFFLKNNGAFKNKGIWFHTCSMGETKSIVPLIEQFDNVNLSVNTNTGFEEAKKHCQNVRYLPYELFLPFWVNQQKVLVVMEAELWYMLFLMAKIRNTPTMLINARISDKSHASYLRFSWLYKRIFKNIDQVFAQSEVDKNRLEQLGASNVEVIGNIKLANLPKVTKSLEKQKELLITA